MSVLVSLPMDRYVLDAFDGFDANVSFSAANCRAMAWAAQLAYEDDTDKVEAILQSWRLRTKPSFVAGHSNPLFQPMTSTRALLFSNGEALVIAFRGTDPLVLANWVTDFAAIPHDSGIHDGFNAALDSIWRDLAALMGSEGKGKKLFITGHSLGAALAALAALRTRDQHRGNVQAICAFGMPRVGNKQFVGNYGLLQKNTYRFVHAKDVVPTVPPTQLGFAHVGVRFSCAADSRFDMRSVDQGSPSPPDDNPSFDRSVVADVAAGLAGNLLSSRLPSGGRTDLVGRLIELLPAPIRDHLPGKYCLAVETAS